MTIVTNTCYHLTIRTTNTTATVRAIHKNKNSSNSANSFKKYQTMTAETCLFACILTLSAYRWPLLDGKKG